MTQQLVDPFDARYIGPFFKRADWKPDSRKRSRRNDPREMRPLREELSAWTVLALKVHTPKCLARRFDKSEEIVGSWAAGRTAYGTADEYHRRIEDMQKLAAMGGCWFEEEASDAKDEG